MVRLVRESPPLFPELSYANPDDPRLKRWFVRSVEELSGRDRYAGLYDIWRNDVLPKGTGVFAGMLDLIDVRVDARGTWPPALTGGDPLVIMANHPYGIGDGIAALSIAERLGRPFKVMINAELLKIREMVPYALPVDFAETKDALRNNIAVRHEALRLLKTGTVVVVFPAGGVATAPRGFGVAEDLPWKVFPARLVQEAKASVLPIHFAGQNGRLFHLASKVSLTARTSLLIREFARLSGKTIEAHIGDVLPWSALADYRDRKALVDRLYRAVFDLAPQRPVKARVTLRRRSRKAA